VLSIALELIANSVFPRVESPWPESIDLGLPVTLGGAFGVLAGVVHACSPRKRRERAITRGGAWGFGIGVLFYVAALVVQVMSNL
jgi:hypothetical protein